MLRTRNIFWVLHPSVCLADQPIPMWLTDWPLVLLSVCLEVSGHFLENTRMHGLWCAGVSWPPLWINFGLCFLIFLIFHNFDLMKGDKCCVHKIIAWWCLRPQIQIMFSNEKGIVSVIGRTVPLLKPPQSPHCHLEAVEHAKNFPPPLATLQARSYRTNRATQTLLFSKPFDLAQVCHGNKICLETDISSTLHIELKVEWNF